MDKTWAERLEAYVTAEGWPLGDTTVYQDALTHTSVLHSGKSIQRGAKKPSPKPSSEPRPFERLEFLGDRVLGLIMAEYLYQQYLQSPEGGLAKRQGVLVGTEVLAKVAALSGLKDLLKTGDADAAASQNVLADCVEAFIAAVYLEQGLLAARDWIHKYWQAAMAGAVEKPEDPKSALQEWAQGRGMSLPVYTVINRSGTDHAPSFTVKVSLDDGKSAEAVAGSKRLGEKQAALNLLQKLEKKN